VRATTIAPKLGCNVPMSVSTGQTYRNVSHHREHICTFSDVRLAGVLPQRHVFDVMQAVLYLPVSTLERSQLCGLLTSAARLVMP
jgi:hypothetical protein